jgi:hypothetical protein
MPAQSNAPPVVGGFDPQALAEAEAILKSLGITRPGTLAEINQPGSKLKYGLSALGLASEIKPVQLGEAASALGLTPDEFVKVFPPIPGQIKPVPLIDAGQAIPTAPLGPTQRQAVSSAAKARGTALESIKPTTVSGQELAFALQTALGPLGQDVQPQLVISGKDYQPGQPLEGQIGVQMTEQGPRITLPSKLPREFAQVILQQAVETAKTAVTEKGKETRLTEQLHAQEDRQVLRTDARHDLEVLRADNAQSRQRFAMDGKVKLQLADQDFRGRLAAGKATQAESLLRMKGTQSLDALTAKFEQAHQLLEDRGVLSSAAMAEKAQYGEALQVLKGQQAINLMAYKDQNGQQKLDLQQAMGLAKQAQAANLGTQRDVLKTLLASGRVDVGGLAASLAQMPPGADFEAVKGAIFEHVKDLEAAGAADLDLTRFKLLPPDIRGRVMGQQSPAVRQAYQEEEDAKLRIARAQGQVSLQNQVTAGRITRGEQRAEEQAKPLRAEAQLWRDPETGAAAPESMSLQEAEQKGYVTIKTQQLGLLGNVQTVLSAIDTIERVGSKLTNKAFGSALIDLPRQQAQSGLITLKRLAGDEDLAELDTAISNILTPLRKVQGDTGNVAVAEQEITRGSLFKDSDTVDGFKKRIQVIRNTMADTMEQIGLKGAAKKARTMGSARKKGNEEKRKKAEDLFKSFEAK